MLQDIAIGLYLLVFAWVSRADPVLDHELGCVRLHLASTFGHQGWTPAHGILVRGRMREDLLLSSVKVVLTQCCSDGVWMLSRWLGIVRLLELVLLGVRVRLDMILLLSVEHPLRLDDFLRRRRLRCDLLYLLELQLLHILSSTILLADRDSRIARA